MHQVLKAPQSYRAVSLRLIGMSYQIRDECALGSGLLQDTYRSFSGAERHKRLMHISDNVKDAKVVRPWMAPSSRGCCAKLCQFSGPRMAPVPGQAIA